MEPYYQNGNITLYHGDVVNVLSDLKNVTVDAIITSPPYADQRKKFYGSVAENLYPEWTAKWMDQAAHILNPNASCLINIRENISNGEISDYVLKTRLELRKSWKECEELIWIKPDGPPVGNVSRPRRSWERILWFSKTTKPNSYPKANGKYSDNISFDKASVGQGLKQWGGGFTDGKEPQSGYTRCKDYVEIAVSNNSKKEHTHPAAYPIKLAEWMIKLVSVDENIILDPFSGSGTTGLAALNQGRKYIGIDSSKEYLDESIIRFDNSINSMYNKIFE